MRIALLMGEHSYAGREYLCALNYEKIEVDVFLVGDYLEIDAMQQEMCGGLWKPPPFKELEKSKDRKIYRFKTLSEEMELFIRKHSYDIGIQGGKLGMLKKSLFDAFRFGILNFHPGDLPAYRGSSAPERQIYEGKKVVATCHLIDSGVDSGHIIAKEELELDYSNYYIMRASIYPKMALFMVNIIKNILSEGKIYSYPQDESLASYCKYIGDEKVKYLKENWTDFIKLISKYKSD